MCIRDRLGISPFTLRRWSAAGYLPCYRSEGGQRRYRSADVVALIGAQTVSATPGVSAASAISAAPALPAAAAQVPANAAAASLDVLAEPLTSSLDPAEVAQAAVNLLRDLVEIDLGAVISADESDTVQLLYATPALAAELGSLPKTALLTAMLGPKSQEDVEVHQFDWCQTPLAKFAALGEMGSVAVVKLYAQDRRLGALWLASRHKNAYGAAEIETIGRLATNLSRALANALMYERVKRSHLGVLKVLGSALGAKDYYSSSHAARVAGYMVLMGRELGWSDTLIDQVEEAAYLHDIGKISVPDRTLNSAMALNDREWGLMKQHPVLGAEIMAPLFGKDLVLAVRHHHERYSGGGYPDGLVGDEIPMLARAMCVADSYDAMSFRRPYRQALSSGECRAEFERCAGSQFDPAMVAAFARVLERMAEARRVARIVAAEAAARIDPARHALLRSREDEARPEFAEIGATLRAVCEEHPPARYAMTSVRAGKRTVIVCDSAPPSPMWGLSGDGGAESQTMTVRLPARTEVMA